MYESEISLYSLDMSQFSSPKPSPDTRDFSLVSNLSSSIYSLIHSNDYESDLELYFHVDMKFMTLSIPFTHPINTHNTIQTPSSLVDSSLDSYAVSLVFVGFKSRLYLIGW